jgi:hypothetical protein
MPCELRLSSRPDKEKTRLPIFIAGKKAEDGRDIVIPFRLSDTVVVRPSYYGFSVELNIIAVEDRATHCCYLLCDTAHRGETLGRSFWLKQELTQSQTLAYDQDPYVFLLDLFASREVMSSVL